ncbi:MAG: DotU family type IV/VI secretion system protein [Planctomycetaceae bacterium]|nr:DotU family type IV/VI secretion system protein [Planctomycetaceae bacterium]
MKYRDAFRPIFSYVLHLEESIRRGVPLSRDAVTWDLGELIDQAGRQRRGQADEYAWFAVACWLRERLDAMAATRDLPVTPDLSSAYPVEFYQRLNLLLQPGNGAVPEKELIRVYLVCLDLGFVGYYRLDEFGNSAERDEYIRTAHEALLLPDEPVEDVTVYRKRGLRDYLPAIGRVAIWLTPPLLTGLLYFAYRNNLDTLYHNIVR